jgi:hypothetical protein
VQVLDDGAFRFAKPDGSAFDSMPPARATAFDCAQLRLQHEAGDIRIDSHTAVTRWRGERMDYGLAVDALQSKVRGKRYLSAETH